MCSDIRTQADLNKRGEQGEKRDWERSLSKIFKEVVLLRIFMEISSNRKRLLVFFSFFLFFWRCLTACCLRTPYVHISSVGSLRVVQA